MEMTSVEVTSAATPLPDGQKGNTMALAVLGYPSLDAADFRYIQAFRADHDPLFRIVAPHLTLVFPVEELPEDTLVGHARHVAQQLPQVKFVLRSLKVYLPHPGEEDAPIFLIPDEGYDVLLQFHDRLYSGPLAPYARHDMAFIPHITIGRKRDQAAAQRAVAEFGPQGFAMHGTLTRLTVVRYANGLVTNLVEALLQGSAVETT